MTEPSGKKPWLEAVRQRARRLSDAARDRCVQLRDGNFKSQRAALLARLRAIKGGSDLLRLAERNRTDIRVVPARRIDGSKGRFSRRKSGNLVRIASCRDKARMTSTLWHELRHLQQHAVRGDLDGGTSRLHDTRRQHIMSLMIEADAYTSQTLMCLREKKAGHPEYLEAFFRRESTAVTAIKAFVAVKPYESFPNDAAFARALFGAIMRGGLANYQAKYFAGYHCAFKKAVSIESLRTVAASTKAAPEFAPDESLTQLYGRSASLRFLSRVYFNMQPPEARDTLRLVEETVAQADTLSPAAFAAARKEILARTAKMSKHFRAAATQEAPGAAKRPGHWKNFFASGKNI